MTPTRLKFTYDTRMFNPKVKSFEDAPGRYVKVRAGD